MSGDVQPRKRKDKRRKRDDDESSHGVHITKMGNDDVHLHVQHEHGTGGHWCAKIIFFSLMAVLLGLVGLIIMENRGIADLDTPLSESRFSNYFDGWVDEHRDEHDEHDTHDPADVDVDESVEEADAEEAEEDLNNGGENKDEEESADVLDEDDDDDEDVADEDGDEDEQENEATTEYGYEDEQENEGTAEDDDKEENVEDEDQDDIEESIEPPKSQSQARSVPDSLGEEFDEELDDEIDEEDDDENAEDEEVEENEESVEPPKTQSEAQNTPDSFGDDFDEEDEDDEAAFESLDQVVNEENEYLKTQETARPANVPNVQDEGGEDNANDEEDAGGSSWLGSLAVKIGVGVALALVSRLVLIRKNPNTTDEFAPEASLRRRLTIATAEDIPDDDEELPPLDDEYSEEEIEIEEEIEVEVSDIEESDIGSDDNIAVSANYVPETFEQLNAMYKSKQEVKEDPPIESTTAKQHSSHPPNNITATNFDQEAKIKPITKSETKNPPDAAPSTDIYVEYDEGDLENLEDNEEITDEEDEISDYELEEGDISDVDDTELMNRLEAKYGRLPAKEFETDEDSDDPTWTQIKPKEAATGAGPKAHLVDDDDEDLFEKELRKANAEMIDENPVNALRAFNTLTQNYAHKPAAHLAHAYVLEHLAEKQRSNQLLEEAINAYKRYLALSEFINDDRELRAAGERCIQHLRFMGYQQQAVDVQKQLIARFPNDLQLRDQLSLTYLMMNNLELVKHTAFETIQRWPDDPVAQLHYGLALKQLHSNYAEALPYLEHGINSLAPGTQEGFFYIALGETLQRLGKHQQALDVHRRGAAQKLFASVYQRSLYNVEGLRAQPFWQLVDTGYQAELSKLQENWPAIRDEAMALLSRGGYFVDETEQLRDTGKWQQYELYAQGHRIDRHCQRAPITCALLADFTAASGCRRGQVKFSAMQAQTHVWPHCGPTNCRLRAHLTLAAPEPQLTTLRVAEQERTWRAGEMLIFDDSFEHEVWHNGTQLRLLLIVDVWHPDLGAEQRNSLTSI